MKFKEFLTESTKDKTTVLAFGRMNPPTTGHAKLVDKVHSLAKEHNADHSIVLSHSHDSDKNPLTPEQKLKHAKRFFPKTKLSLASKEHPSFLSHAEKLHKSGTKHLIMVGGSDRVDEYHKILHKYNGEGDKKLFNFKSIKVVSAGERDPDAEGTSGMSASKMRAHASSNNYNEFKKGIPSHVPEKHARELFSDVQNGIKEKKKSIRERYLNSEIYNIGDRVFVENKEVQIIARASNFVTIETESGSIEKRWLDDVKEEYSVFDNVVEEETEIPALETRKKVIREIPRLLMTPKQIKEESEKIQKRSQVSYMGYTTKNFDVEPKAREMFQKLIAAIGEVTKPESESEKKATAVEVGSLVKPTHIRHQQTKNYLNN
jgi:hypothetical protein